MPMSSEQMKGIEGAEQSKKELHVINYTGQWFGTESMFNPVIVW